MSIWPTVLGASTGLAIAVIANIVVLPRVLKLQESRGPTTPGTRSGQISVASGTKFAYRVVMPVVFAIVFAIVANKEYALGGGGQ